MNLHEFSAPPASAAILLTGGAGGHQPPFKSPEGSLEHRAIVPERATPPSESRLTRSGVAELRSLLLRVDEILPSSADQQSYVVDELLPIAGTSMLAGKPKKGKSTLARQLAVCVASGEPFLGRPTIQGKVLYLALEEKVEEVKRHFDLLGVSESPNLFLLPSLFGLPRETLYGLIREEQPVLVVIDTLVRLGGIKDFNDYAKVNAILGPIQDVARASRAHIMLVHHANKKSSDDVMDSVLGSSGLTGAVDTVIALQEGTNRVRVLSSRGRYQAMDMEQTVLHVDRDARRYSLGNTVQEEVRLSKSAATNDLHERLVGFVELHPGCTEPEIYKGVSGSTDAIAKALRELRTTRLHVEGDGKRGSPFRHHTEIPVEASLCTENLAVPYQVIHEVLQKLRSEHFKLRAGERRA